MSDKPKAKPACPIRHAQHAGFHLRARGGMRDGLRVGLLILVMAGVAMLATGIAIRGLYVEAVAQKLKQLESMVALQKSFIEVISAKEDATQDIASAAVQVTQAYARYPWRSATGEFLIGIQDGGIISILVQSSAASHGGNLARTAQSLQFSATGDTPMHRALAGQSGSMNGVDLWGHEVLAAYRPATIWGAAGGVTVGLVAKIDMAEFDAPFAGAMYAAGAASLILVLIGALLIIMVNRPWILRLKENEVYIRSVVETAQDGIITIDEAGTIRSVNPAVGRLFGYAAEELIGQSVTRLMPEEDGERHDPAIRNHLATGQAKVIGKGRELEGQRKDGTRFPIHLSVSAFQVGGARYFSGLIKDVTALKEAEHQLQAINADLELRVAEQTAELTKISARLRYLVDNNPAVIYSGVPLPEFRVTYISDNLRAILGAGPAGIADIHEFWESRLHDDDRVSLAGRNARMEQTRQQTSIYRVRHQDGHYVWVEDTMRIIRGADNRPLEVVGTLFDITLRKNAEDSRDQLARRMEETKTQLIQAEKMASIGQLAAGVAHEINNPVGYINANMGSLNRYLAQLFRVLDAYQGNETLIGQDPAALAALMEIKQQADIDYMRGDINALMSESMEGLERVKKIVGDLKDFSRMEQAVWQDADIRHGLDSTLNIARNEIKYKAQVVREYGELPPVECMPSQLNQVFLNLLINAAQAIPEHGTITVRTGQNGDEVWVEIEDTGSGIPAEHLDRIFEPFFTTKPVGKGTGLGLSLAYGIVKKHGGRIDVKSTVGQGTRFRIWLPIRQPAGTERHPAGQEVAV